MLTCRSAAVTHREVHEYHDHKRFFAGLADIRRCIGLGALPIFSAAMSLAAVFGAVCSGRAASVW